MILPRYPLLPTIAAALLLLVGASISRTAKADRIDARFEIFGFAGLHVLTERTTVEEAADRYAITTDLNTNGLARVFVDLTSRSTVHGTSPPETDCHLLTTAPIRAETAPIVITASITVVAAP